MKFNIKNKLIKVYWNLQSEIWDNYNTETEYEKETKEIVKIIKEYVKTNGLSLLDVGCATGNFSIEFAKCGFNVFGVDLSNKMIEKANSKISNTPNVKFINSNISEVTKMKNIKFDVIFVSHVIHLILKTYQNLIDILNNNGIFVIVEKNKKIGNKVKHTSVLKNIITSLIKNILYKIYCNKTAKSDYLDILISKGLIIDLEAYTENNKLTILKFK